MGTTKQAFKIKIIPMAIILVSLFLTLLLTKTTTSQYTEIQEQDQASSTLTEEDYATSLDQTLAQRQSKAEEAASESQALAESKAQMEEKEEEEEIERIQEAMEDNSFQGERTQTIHLIEDYLKKENLVAEDVGYLYLPEHPAQLPDMKKQGHQLDVPLYIQKDPQWRSLKYGSNTTRELGENGCAIVSLAMVDSYLTKRPVKPCDILKWSQEEYYVHDQGTSWSIFYDFAIEHGHQFYNYGNDFHSAMQGIMDGQVLIASVKEGMFTSFGHLIVIRGYDPVAGLVYVNDPNDDPSKMHSIYGIDQEVLLEEGLNYWAFYE